MKFLHIIIIFFICSILSVNAQEEYFDNPYADSVYYKNDIDMKENKPDLPKRIIRPSMQMGTSYTSFGHSQSVFSTYTKPGLAFNLSSKLIISSGFMFVNSNYNFSSQNEGDANNTLNSSMAYFYTSGIYQVNERLIVSGTVVKELSNNHLQNFSNTNSSFDIQSGSVGFLYKLTDNMYLGAEFGFNNKQNPFYNNNNYSPFYSPFY